MFVIQNFNSQKLTETSSISIVRIPNIFHIHVDIDYDQAEAMLYITNKAL